MRSLLTRLKRYLAFRLYRALDLGRITELEAENRALAGELAAVRGDIKSIAQALSLGFAEAEARAACSEQRLSSAFAEITRRHAAHLEAVASLVTEADNQIRLEARQAKGQAEAVGAQIAALKSEFASREARSAVLESGLAAVHAETDRAARLAAEADGQVVGMQAFLHYLDRTVGRLDAEAAITRKQLERGGATFGFLRQAQSLARVPELVFFCSRGRTGSAWLTEALNLHGDILAAHGPGMPPYRFLGKPEARRKTSRDQHWRKHVGEVSLAQAREEMVWAGAARFYCYVHSVTPPEIAGRLGADLTAGRITAVNLIRHPVTRINSFARFWAAKDRRLRRHLIGRWSEEEVFAQYRDRLSAAFPVDFSQAENILFVMACHWLLFDQSDFQYPLQVFQFERLVAEQAYMRKLLEASFGPALDVTSEYLDRVSQLGRRNCATAEGAAPEQVYGGWAEWQRHCFDVVLGHLDLPRLYADFGYDFSFIASQRPIRARNGPASRFSKGRERAIDKNAIATAGLPEASIGDAAE